MALPAGVDTAREVVGVEDTDRHLARATTAPIITCLGAEDVALRR